LLPQLWPASSADSSTVARSASAAASTRCGAAVLALPLLLLLLAYMPPRAPLLAVS
jgi:hypothetical protein